MNREVENLGGIGKGNDQDILYEIFFIKNYGSCILKEITLCQTPK